MKLAGVLFIGLSWTSPALAGYTVTGSVEGSFCSGFIIKSCSIKRIDAVFDGDQPYNLPAFYEAVDEHSKSKKRCWIKIESGALNRVIGDIPIFYQYTSGPKHLKASYTELGTPEFVTFPCERD